MVYGSNSDSTFNRNLIAFFDTHTLVHTHAHTPRRIHYINSSLCFTSTCVHYAKFYSNQTQTVMSSQYHPCLTARHRALAVLATAFPALTTSVPLGPKLFETIDITSSFDSLSHTPSLPSTKNLSFNGSIQ